MPDGADRPAGADARSRSASRSSCRRRTTSASRASTRARSRCTSASRRVTAAAACNSARHDAAARDRRRPVPRHLAEHGGDADAAARRRRSRGTSASTDAAPVEHGEREDLLSIDGGHTYPYVLAASTPNDGSRGGRRCRTSRTTKARVKVEAVGNVFFDVSNADFTIGALPKGHYVKGKGNLRLGSSAGTYAGEEGSKADLRRGPEVQPEEPGGPPGPPEVPLPEQRPRPSSSRRRTGSR